MFDVKVTSTNIVDKVLDTCNLNEGWVVKKMKLKYAYKIVTILPIIY